MHKHLHNSLLKLGTLLLVMALSAMADENFESLLGNDLSDLLNMEVTSVARKPEKATETAAAVFVMTSEDIRRGGFLSIAEALRAVPGIQVAAVNNSHWAISSRGFSNIFSDKLLVMIDGRTVYTPLFAGVFWEVQDVMLEDVDRIEIIRGAGSTMWGANAVNGIIHIITKKSSQTQGGLVTMHAGNEERGGLAVRYGGSVNENAYYRLYTKTFKRDDSAQFDGSDANDERESFQVGGRLDWEISAATSILLDFSAYQQREAEYFSKGTSSPPYFEIVDNMGEVGGGHLQMALKHQVDADTSWKLQGYYARTERLMENLEIDRDMVDLDYQYETAFGEHELLLGAGYRFSKHHLNNKLSVSLSDSNDDNNLYSFFIQDKVALADDKLSLTLGLKLERNDFTQWELQHSASLAWLVNERHTLWTSVAKVVQHPSIGFEGAQLGRTVHIPPATTFNNYILGNNEAVSTEVMAYELGHRYFYSDDIYFDSVIFYNKYRHSKSLEWTAFNTLQFGNKLNGETYGAELVCEWKVNEEFILHGSYSLLFIDMHSGSSTVNDIYSGFREGVTPRNQVKVRGDWQISDNVDCSISLYYMDSLTGVDVDDYYRTDFRLGWKPLEDLSVDFVIQNIFDDQHQEYSHNFFEATPVRELERSYYLKLNYRF